jgi:hypothetical protein
MSFVDRISDGLMALAARCAPPRRREIVRAMRHEFVTLDRGRLSWALGCLRAAVVWRAASAAPFGLVLVGAGMAFDAVQPLPLMLLRGDVHVAPAAIYLYWLAAPGLACGLLAIWKPAYAYVSAVGFALLRELMSFFQIAFVMHASWRGWEVMDAPPVVGWSAILAWCLLGAGLGRRWKIVSRARSV